MKLSDYINYRNRGKKNKNTEYMIRTQHFYDGVKTIDGEQVGIQAEFMNRLSIPSNQEIIRAQKEAFLALQKTKVQHQLLEQFNKSISQTEIAKVNDKIVNDLVSLAHDLEQAIDNLGFNNKDYKKTDDIAEQASLDAQLSMCYANFKKVFNIILKKGQQISPQGIIPAMQELQNDITLLESYVKRNDNLRSGLFDKTALGLKTKEGKDTSFLSRLSYLSKNIRGVQLLEHGGLDFIKKAFGSILDEENIVIVNSGQILNSSAQQLSQDALMFDKNIQIEVKDNNNTRKMSILDYFDFLEQKAEKEGKTTISIGDDELSQILNLAAGIQAKYSRYGWIKMLGNFSIERIFQYQYCYARALRNLHVLATGAYGDYKLRKDSNKERVKFSLKQTDKAQKDYNALFNMCLASFMEDIMSKNFFMLTAEGLEESSSFYARLFDAGSYFRAKGNVKIADLTKKYDIQINSNINK